MKLPEKEVKLRKRTRLVQGVGVNDADYNVKEHAIVDGKDKIVWVCPFYQTWERMLERCYSEKLHKKRASYKGCKVCDEWLIFSNFKRWMETQDWQGKQLDKDLLVEGNKVYSPDTCIFVHRRVNSFVTSRVHARGKYMLGVSWHKGSNNFTVSCRDPFTGKNGHLGIYTDELEAHLAWKARKHELACQLADSEYVTDERLANALRTRYNEQSDWTNK